MPDAKKKVLLVGWDAADWKVIHPLMDSGLMPTTSRLVDSGVMGNIRTLSPVLSPMLWTSIATGKRPYKHGIYGFTEPSPDGTSVQPMTNVSRRCKAIWNILNQTGLQSNVVGWWPSHPAEPINGVMVSDYYNKTPKRPGDPWPLMQAAVHPKRCFEEIADLRLHPSELEPDHILPFLPNGREIDQENDPRFSMCMRTFCECTTIQAAATHIMETEPWDFMAVYFDSIDHFSHGFMKYHPPKQSHVSDEDFHLYSNVINAGYIYHDMMLARLLELAGDDTTVILMSDHGFHPDHLRPKKLPTEPAGPAWEHRDLGILVMSGPGIRHDHTVHGATLLDITPTILTLFDLPVGEDMDGRVLLEAFEDQPDIAAIPSWEDVPGESGRHPAGFRLDPAESKEAMEQLVALGYIERPDDDQQKAIAQCQRELDYNLARAYMDGGMYGESIPLLVGLYNGNPLEFRFGIQLANSLYAMGRTNDLGLLIDDLNNRWRIARKESRARLRDVAAITKERRAQWDELNALDEENQKLPDPPARLARLTAKGKAQLFTEAEGHMIRKLRAVARGNPQTLDFLAATVAVSKGDYEKALEHLEHTKVTESRSAGFQFQVGNVYLGLGRLEEAEAAYRRGLEFDEFHANCHMGLCRVFIEQGDYQQAAECGRTAIGLKFQLPTAHFFLGQALNRSGDIAAAILEYEIAIDQNPNFAEAHDELAVIFQQDGHIDADRSEQHKSEARDLRWQMAKFEEDREPIQLPEFDQEVLNAAIPVINSEETQNTETFLKCLAQPPRPVIMDIEEFGPVEERASVVIVSGLPRSGTSMMMQMLVAVGIEPYTDGERIPDESNPKGYYETELVKKLAHENSWVADADGKVIKVVAPLVPYLPRGLNYRVIYMDRDIGELLESQSKMLGRLGESGADLSQDRLGAVFLKQAQFAAHVCSMHRVPILSVPYPVVIADPRGAAEKIAEFLEMDLDVDAMAAAVDPSLYRERSAEKA